MKNSIYIKNVIIFSIILFLAYQSLGFYFSYFNLGSFSTGDTLLFSIYWYALMFSNILVIYFALKRIILKSKELNLAKMILASLAIFFIAYNLSFFTEYIKYYYIDEKDKIVALNSVDRLKNLLDGIDHSAPSYEPFNTFIKYPYLVLVDILSTFNIIRLFFFLITDRIIMPILLSLALYKWYKKHPEKLK
ncbi:hypothetical protein [Chryseobacterium gleum]|uniref:hypothetical protein n=1 Tax=Chryseobacterium gleum TaxID=250 RepID=UPI001E28F8D7|nr:hypothetical protein [Chryseobacterium gleum]MCD9617242.1 hypothetical protein [Chryseobacterium gleum]